MGSHRVVLPESKFSGEEDVREFLRDFKMYVAVNEWSDEKAGQYLAVFLKDDAKAFFHQQSETVKKSFSELSEALKQRYEGGLALLKYKRDFNSRSRKDGEPLHSYLADLRMAYDRAYAPPVVDELPDSPSAAQKKKNNEQISALAFYESRKPSGDLRICVDYRKLNEATKVASYPLPNMTETLDRLADAKFFTTIDMVSGYHQIEVAPEDRHKTAFVSPFGLFQYC